MPDHFKLSNVIPIHKKDSVTISLLSIFNKILEKLVHYRVVNSTDNTTFYMSTSLALEKNTLQCMQLFLQQIKIQRAIEDGLFSCGIFLDFSKAFDAVNRSILIRKLSHYGKIANDWFASYLHNRRQHVSIGSTKSDDIVIIHGVPLGSALGPLLFLLYINDFINCINFDFQNNNLKFVSNWLLANKLSLNVDKTNFILFHPPHESISHVVKLLIANREIKQEHFIKYLGLHIDSRLSWKFHIFHISKKIKRCIGILSKIRYFFSQQVLVQLSYTLIYPFLTYSLIIWGNTYPTSLQPLITLQKKAVRIITFFDFKFSF